MEDRRIPRIIYTFFIGILLAVFVGVGINTFYPPPPAPRYPIGLNSIGKEPTIEQQAAQRAFDIQNEKYQQALKPYNRNVSMAALIAAVILLAASIVLQRFIQFIPDGVMLGGLFTLLYSIGRGFASENSRYMFVIVTIGLAVSLYLGYRRFAGTHKPPPNTAAAAPHGY